METIYSHALWIVPATNMYAVDTNGEKIVPDPSARTGPIENVIMNVTDSDRYVYHYTSLDTGRGAERVGV